MRGGSERLLTGLDGDMPPGPDEKLALSSEDLGRRRGRPYFSSASGVLKVTRQVSGLVPAAPLDPEVPKPQWVKPDIGKRARLPD